MSRHAIPGYDPRHEVTVGFDPPLATYFAQVHDTTAAEEEDAIVLWVGTEHGEIASAHDLARLVAPYAMIQPQMISTLIEDRICGRTEPAEAPKSPVGHVVMHVIRPDGRNETRRVPAPSGLDAIRALVAPHLNGGEMEHVAVLFHGKRADLFCDEDFQAKGLPFNVIASDLYRAATLAHSPDAAADEMPGICGTAVLFAGQVWR